MAIRKHMAKTYADEIKEEEMEFDPSSAKDIIELQELVDDDDLQGAASNAVEDGWRAGGENEISQSLIKAVKDNEFVVFDGEGDFAWDTKCYYAIPIDKIVDLIKQDDDIGYTLNHEGWSETLEDGKVDVSQPYNGWSDYDEKAAEESFGERVYDFLPRD